MLIEYNSCLNYLKSLQWCLPRVNRTVFPFQRDRLQIVIKCEQKSVENMLDMQ